MCTISPKVDLEEASSPPCDMHASEESSMSSDGGNKVQKPRFIQWYARHISESNFAKLVICIVNVITSMILGSVTN